MNGSYYILNAGRELFDEIQEQIDNGATKEEMIEFWLSEKDNYEVSDWSESFSDLSS